MGFKEEGVFKDMIYGNKMSVGLSPDKDKETLKIRM